MKEKVDLTRSVPFLKPGNPYQLLDAVCRGPTPHCRRQSLDKTPQASHQTTNPHPTQPTLPTSLVIRPKPLHAGMGSSSPKGEEELSGDVECLLVLEAQVRG